MTVSGPTFRPFTPDDLAAMQRVRQAAFEPIFRSFRSIVGEEVAAFAFMHADAEQGKLLADMSKDDSRHQLLVVTIADQIVGFVSFTINADQHKGEIGLNAVHPDHAGRGIGTASMSTSWRA